MFKISLFLITYLELAKVFPFQPMRNALKSLLFYGKHRFES